MGPIGLRMSRTKVTIYDFEDRTGEAASRAPTTDGAGGFVFQDAGGGHLTGTVVVLDEGVQIGVFDELRFIGAGVQVFNSGSYAAIAITGSAAAPAPGGGSGSIIVPVFENIVNTSTRTISSAVASYYDIPGTSGTFSVDRNTDVIIIYDSKYSGQTNNWEYCNQRLVFDGTGTTAYQKSRDGGPLWSEVMMISMHWHIAQVPSGTHDVQIQVYESASHSDPRFYATSVNIIAPNGGTRWVETGV